MEDDTRPDDRIETVKKIVMLAALKNMSNKYGAINGLVNCFAGHMSPNELPDSLDHAGITKLEHATAVKSRKSDKVIPSWMPELFSKTPKGNSHNNPYIRVIINNATLQKILSDKRHLSDILEEDIASEHFDEKHSLWENLALVTTKYALKNISHKHVIINNIFNVFSGDITLEKIDGIYDLHKACLAKQSPDISHDPTNNVYTHKPKVLINPKAIRDVIFNEACLQQILEENNKK
jgi:hypothetical protein